MEEHLEGLTVVEKRLVKAYATLIMGDEKKIEDVPEKLRPYVLAEIEYRMNTLISEDTE